MIGMITRARAFSTEALKVVNNVARQQFVVSLKGVDAVVDYQLKDSNSIVFVHTEVPEVFRGKGVGKLLAKYAFDHALEQDMNVICQCHFLSKFYEDNLEKYNKLRVTLDLDQDFQDQ